MKSTSITVHVTVDFATLKNSHKVEGTIHSGVPQECVGSFLILISRSHEGRKLPGSSVLPKPEAGMFKFVWNTAHYDMSANHWDVYLKTENGLATVAEVQNMISIASAFKWDSKVQ